MWPWELAQSGRVEMGDCSLDDKTGALAGSFNNFREARQALERMLPTPLCQTVLGAPKIVGDSLALRTSHKQRSKFCSQQGRPAETFVQQRPTMFGDKSLTSSGRTVWGQSLGQVFNVKSLTSRTHGRADKPGGQVCRGQFADKSPSRAR